MVSDRPTNNDRNDRQNSEERGLPESLSGENHPLSMVARETLAASSGLASANQFDPKTVKEVITDNRGQTHTVALGDRKLSSGDHTLQFGNGRQFVVHVPEHHGKQEMPVMFVISPSVHTNQGYDNKNFEAETGMNRYSDKDKFVAVYALNENHLLGGSSKKPAEAWNAPGCGINDADLKRNGYNDEDYIKAIASMMPQLANVDPSHKDWGAIAFSQGGMFLNQLAHDQPNLFPSVGLVGSTFQNGHDYSIAAGNARNTMIVNLHGDNITYPFPNEEGVAFKSQKALATTLDALSDVVYGANALLHGHLPPRHKGLSDGWGAKVAEKIDALGGIDNRDQNPQAQQDYYEKRIQDEGTVSTTHRQLLSPARSAKKDAETQIRSNNGNSLTIFDLATAKHSWPGPDHGSHVNSTAQYTEFNSSEQFVNLFEAYNQKLKHGL